MAHSEKEKVPFCLVSRAVPSGNGRKLALSGPPEETRIESIPRSSVGLASRYFTKYSKAVFSNSINYKIS